MFNLRKPDWLYEALPYVYVVAGIAIIANLGDVLSTVGGGLLISAGVLIWSMRRTYRQNRRRRVVDRRDAIRREAERGEAERRDAIRKEVERREVDRRDAERRRSLR